MSSTMLYNEGGHSNVLIEESDEHGLAVQSNQHLILHDGAGMILDPGGHKVYNRVLSEMYAQVGLSGLKYIFLSHQDPDIIAAINGWLMTTDADAWISKLWVRFVPHFGLDHLVAHRLKPIPDEGMLLDLNGVELVILPAHFMHSCGNFQVYDPISRILYTGDLGASLGMDYTSTSDWDSHLPYMDGFHRRYIASNVVLRRWVKMVRQLDIEIIAPQHGAFLKGKAICQRFLDYLEELPCGVDVMDDVFQIPTA